MKLNAMCRVRHVTRIDRRSRARMDMPGTKRRSTLNGFRIQEDESGNARHSPGCSACNCQSPIATLARRNVGRPTARSEEHTSELQSLIRTSYAVFCLQKK